MQRYVTPREAYGSAFDRLLVTEHVLIETEVAGKSSNENFALRELRRVLDAEGVDPFEVQPQCTSASQTALSLFI